MFPTPTKMTTVYIRLGQFSGSNSCKYLSVLGRCTISSDVNWPTFQRCLLHLSPLKHLCNVGKLLPDCALQHPVFLCWYFMLISENSCWNSQHSEMFTVTYFVGVCVHFINMPARVIIRTVACYSRQQSWFSGKRLPAMRGWNLALKQLGRRWTPSARERIIHNRRKSIFWMYWLV
jgi:hypothetical protein